MISLLPVSIPFKLLLSTNFTWFMHGNGKSSPSFRFLLYWFCRKSPNFFPFQWFLDSCVLILVDFLQKMGNSAIIRGPIGYLCIKFESLIYLWIVLVLFQILNVDFEHKFTNLVAFERLPFDVFFRLMYLHYCCVSATDFSWFLQKMEFSA